MKKNQRRLLAEQERLQSLQAEKQQNEQLEKSIKKPITKKTVYGILLVILIFIGIYFITTLISSKQSQNQLIENVPDLRSYATSLSDGDVRTMLKNKRFFDSYNNKTGKGFSNRLGAAIMNDGKVVLIDSASGLMWQKGGSADYMIYNEAEEYIQELNRDKFAGFKDWRLPTLEEAMSLMEPKKTNGNLYIDSKFDAKQLQIWTSDPVLDAEGQWIADFLYGYCNFTPLYHHHYVRAVRFGQSSPE